MKNRLIFIVVALAVIAIAMFLFLRERRPSTTKIEPRGAFVESAASLYNKAEKAVKEGRLLEARQTYKRLLAKHPESKLVNNARTKLDELNMRILFSPIPTEDSIFYEVKPGDTLGKIAKNYGTTVELIMKSNNLKNTLIRPRMRLKISKAKYGILIDISQNILILKSDDVVLKTYTISTGADNSTPTGAYQIKNKLIDPTWYKTGAIVPPGSPENILGSRWIGLTLPGYGIHGTTDESSIGEHITAGCVRMKNTDIEELYSIIPPETRVTIID